ALARVACGNASPRPAVRSGAIYPNAAGDRRRRRDTFAVLRRALGRLRRCGDELRSDLRPGDFRGAAFRQRSRGRGPCRTRWSARLARRLCAAHGRGLVDLSGTPRRALRERATLAGSTVLVALAQTARGLTGANGIGSEQIQLLNRRTRRAEMLGRGAGSAFIEAEPVAGDFEAAADHPGDRAGAGHALAPGRIVILAA